MSFPPLQTNKLNSGNSNKDIKKSNSPRSNDVDLWAEKIIRGESIQPESIPTKDIIGIIRKFKEGKTISPDSPKFFKINRTISKLATSARQSILSSTNGYEIAHQKADLEKCQANLISIKRQKQYLSSQNLISLNTNLIKVIAWIVSDRTIFMSPHGPELPYDFRIIVQNVNKMREKELLLRKAHKYKEANELNSQIDVIENNDLNLLSKKYNLNAISEYFKMISKHQRQLHSVEAIEKSKLSESLQPLEEEEKQIFEKIGPLKDTLEKRIGKEKFQEFEMQRIISKTNHSLTTRNCYSAQSRISSLPVYFSHTQTFH